MIQYQGVSKVFETGSHAVTAINNVTCEIERGDLVTFLGPSGCGKTTLLRLTNRLIPLTGGKIMIKGRDIMSWDEIRLRQSIGYAIQEIGLFPNKTIYGNIAVVPRLLGWEERRIKKRVHELLLMLRLEPAEYSHRYPVELSGGQQQRIGVARCLAADPDILLMDEPFGAIDPINRDEIQDEFLKVQQTLKKTIAFVTHDIHEAIKMSDKIAIFQEGRLIQYETPARILMEPANQYIADFVGADRALKLLGLLRAREAMSADTVSAVDEAAPSREIEKRFDEETQAYRGVTNKGKRVGHTPRKASALVREHRKNLAEPAPHAVHMDDNLRDVLSKMLLHDRKELPVIDDNGILKGTINYDDVHRCIMKIYYQNSESE
jgi:osmoprotectant transport system ATP-binding protein